MSCRTKLGDENKPLLILKVTLWWFQWFRKFCWATRTLSCSEFSRKVLLRSRICSTHQNGCKGIKNVGFLKRKHPLKQSKTPPTDRLHAASKLILSPAYILWENPPASSGLLSFTEHSCCNVKINISWFKVTWQPINANLLNYETKRCNW